MMANATLVICVISENLHKLQEIAWFVAYYVSMPIYFIVGMFGNVTLLIAFNRQAESEKGYMYQIFLTVSKLLEIFTFSLFMATYKWFSGVEAPGSAWYMESYPLMFFATHMASPIFNSFIMVSLLLSVAMAADRVFALTKPFVYRSIDHAKHQTVAALICTLAGVATSAFEVKRWKIESIGRGDNVSYVGQFDEEYLNTEVAMSLGHLRTGIRLIAVVCLVVLNVVMIVSFRKHTNKVGQMLCKDKKELEKKANEKILLVLTVYQSALTAFSQIPHSAHLIASFAIASFGPCYGTVSGPFVDTCIQIADAADFFVVIAINKRIRKAVFNVYPRCAGSSVT